MLGAAGVCQQRPPSHVSSSLCCRVAKSSGATASRRHVHVSDQCVCRKRSASNREPRHTARSLGAGVQTRQKLPYIDACATGLQCGKRCGKGSCCVVSCCCPIQRRATQQHPHMSPHSRTHRCRPVLNPNRGNPMSTRQHNTRGACWHTQRGPQATPAWATEPQQEAMQTGRRGVLQPLWPWEDAQGVCCMQEVGERTALLQAASMPKGVPGVSEKRQRHRCCTRRQLALVPSKHAPARMMGNAWSRERAERVAAAWDVTVGSQANQQCHLVSGTTTPTIGTQLQQHTYAGPCSTYNSSNSARPTVNNTTHIQAHTRNDFSRETVSHPLPQASPARAG